MSLRRKLLLAIGLIMVVTQLISTLWVWHESQEQVTIVLGESLVSRAQNELIQHELDETVVALLAPSALMIILSLAVIYFTINRLTRPLSVLTQELETRSSTHLQPLARTDGSAEVDAITQRLNQLFARIEVGLANERRFTADVAHELRTPLAGLRLNLELVNEAALPEKTLLINRIDQMMVSIEQLLQLAHVGQRLRTGHEQAFDLIAEVITPLQEELLDDPFPHPLRWVVPERMPLLGDSGLIYLLLRNVLENARYYAASGAETVVSLTHNGQGQVVLSVIDNGPGVPSDQLAIIGQRFARLDQTRSGYGLGLSIVERICQVHQAQLTLANRSDDHGLVVTVRFSL
ncbi:two-component system sensor histidine kinase PmrB [Neisseriaceae bacterium CLB008]|nr:two-component system sensor histidine kinase PmrB [Neisseriaceae bacterium]